MKLRSSIIAILALSSMSFAGGDIGGVTTFETGDVAAAEVEAIEEVVPEVQQQEEEIVTDNSIVEEAPKIVEQPKEVVTTNTIQPKKEEPQMEKPSLGAVGPYVGLAATGMAIRLDDRANLFSDEDYQDRQLGLTAVVGYDFMDYLGAELRAALAVSGDDSGHDKFKSAGVYLKPKYPIGDLNLYGLLGYAQSNMSDPGRFTGKNSGFSYGGGLDYRITENISVFTDVVDYLRDEDGSNSTWGANLGVKYNF
jgi:hypothetical protein